MIEWDEIINGDSPWYDAASDFYAMCIESAMRGCTQANHFYIPGNKNGARNYLLELAYINISKFLISGRQVYALSPAMVDSFANTSLENVRAADIHPPHGCAYIELPDGMIKHDHGYVRGLYVLSKEDEITITGWVPRINPGEESHYLWMDLEFPNDDLEPLEKNGRLAFLPEVEEDCSTCHKGNAINMSIVPKGQIDSEAMLDEWTDATDDCATKSFRIAINCILYMNSQSAHLETIEQPNTRQTRRMERKAREATNPKKKRKYTRKSYELPTHTVIRIGPAHLQGDTPYRPADDRRGQRMHCRRGHWHRYRIGPKSDNNGIKIPNEKRKGRLNWLEPIWVGQSDNGVVESHIYKIGGAE